MVDTDDLKLRMKTDEFLRSPTADINYVSTAESPSQVPSKRVNIGLVHYALGVSN